VRRRSLRRHAIETGILERLYDAEWGVTEALVAEGLTAGVAAREGGVTDDALRVIQGQFQALSHLADSARQICPLSVSFIRQLHAALCGTQATYEAKDQFGGIVQRRLRLGAWKESANRAITDDGRVVEFTPPEQVAVEIERMLQIAASRPTCTR
jgi:hypothetical protein